MNKKPVEPDEMRMPADKFDEIMRRALGVPPPRPAPNPADVKRPQKPARKNSRRKR